MVTNPVGTELGNERTGKVRTIGTARNPRLFGSTLPYLTLMAVRTEVTLAETAIAAELFYGYLLVGVHALIYLQHFLHIVIFPGTI